VWENSMFLHCPNFTSDISDWDVSSVTYMPDMFGLATSFNGDLSNWDVSNVVTLRGMFWNAHTL
jgi:bacterial surface protein 26-residue repeat